VTVLALFVLLVFAYSLVSERVERVATAPIVFTLAGMAAPLLVPELRTSDYLLRHYLWVAEGGLVLLLFTDATRTDLALLRKIGNLPARLLGPGLLLTVVLGALAALLVLRQLSFWEAAILAAILAPTDAGLGQVIVESPRVPARIREAINVEAGLNDGLSVPLLLFFMAMLGAREGGAASSLLRFVGEQLGYGVLVGAAIGLVGGWLIARASRGEMVAAIWVPRAVVALPIFCALASEAVAASMFIAAFVCGLTVQRSYPEAGAHAVEFSEQWGQLFNLAIFFLFGVAVERSASQLEPAYFLYGALSLTIVRMLPVAVSLYGTGLARATSRFIGWFGPRGLASIVLGLVYIEQEVHTPGETAIHGAVIATVLMSILLHGLSARPGISWYARKVAALPATAPERSEG